jgi:hypothetical protein
VKSNWILTGFRLDIKLRLGSGNASQGGKMKVQFKKGLSGYSGTSDGAVYYYHPRLKKCLVREYVIPQNKTNTDRTRSIMANLKLLEPSEAYKADFRNYLLAYNADRVLGEKPLLAWTNAFMRMMHALQKAMPGQVDLKTISRQQIYDQNLPCKTLKDAIEYGLLPALKGYGQWDNDI